MSDQALADHVELGQQVRHGARWSLVNTVLTRVLSVAFSIAMARILVPDDYGIFAAGFVMLAALQSMNELGVSVAIVRWQGDTTRPARTAMTLAIGSSTVLATAMVLSAPAVAEAMNAPKAVNVIRLLAVGVILDGISSIPAALLTRSFRQRTRAFADLTGLIVSSLVAIVLAKNGFGAMSLAWSSIVGNAIVTSMVIARAPIRPRPGWRRDDASTLIAFGLPLAATSFVMLAVLNVSFVVVGRILGSTALGFYLIAFNLASWPSNLLSLAVRRVSVPAFARLTGRPDLLWPAFCRSFAGVATLVVPAGIMLGLLGDSAITVLYGDRWRPAFEALRWLAVFGAVRVLVDLCYDALAALGQSKSLLRAQLLWLGTLVAALIVGSRVDGIRGAALAHAACSLLVSLPAHLWALHRRGLAWSELAKPLARPALGAAAAAGFLVATGPVGWAPLPSLLVLGGVAGVLFAVIAVRPDELRRVMSSGSKTEEPEPVAVGIPQAVLT